MQLIGQDFQGNTVYEVVHSDLRVPLGKPVYLAAVVSTTPTPEHKTGGEVIFYLKDLSDAEAPLQSRTVRHPIVQGLQDPSVRVIVGGRDEPRRHFWDGPVARIGLADGRLAADALWPAAGEQAGRRLIDLTFGSSDDSNEGAHTWLASRPAEPSGPPADLLGAVTDFCHALLNSNEFLYLH